MSFSKSLNSGGCFSVDELPVLYYRNNTLNHDDLKFTKHSPIIIARNAIHFGILVGVGGCGPLGQTSHQALQSVVGATEGWSCLSGPPRIRGGTRRTRHPRQIFPRGIVYQQRSPPQIKPTTGTVALYGIVQCLLLLRIVNSAAGQFHFIAKLPSFDGALQL